jgi:ubiquitin-conjugating enzyme E2 J2
MASDMCTRRLTRELRSLQKDPLKSPKIVALPNEANILEWHYVIEGNKGTPYEGGYYHGKLLFPKEYPLKPPSVIMLTPSGRFQPNRRLCLSMSDFHPESWNPMWSVGTILTGLYSFMVETGPTLGSIETSELQKKKFAIKSLDFNVRDSMFCKLFPEYVDLQKERQELKKAALPASQSLSSSSTLRSAGGGPVVANPQELQGLYPFMAGIFAIISIFIATRFL